MNRSNKVPASHDGVDRCEPKSTRAPLPRTIGSRRRWLSGWPTPSGAGHSDPPGDLVRRRADRRRLTVRHCRGARTTLSPWPTARVRRTRCCSCPRCTADLARVEDELRAAVETDDDLPHRDRRPPDRGRRQAGPPGLRHRRRRRRRRGEPGPAAHDVVLGGVSVELVHLGSLYHDDVMDEADDPPHRRAASTPAGATSRPSSPATSCWPRRRRSPPASAPRSPACSPPPSAGCARARSASCSNVFDVARTEDAYLAAIDGKTAALFAAACRIGGIVGRARPGAASTRSPRSARSYGMAFQIVDDVLDVVATDEELGKPAGHDLVEGVYTLPVIRTPGRPPDRERAAPAARPAARARPRWSGPAAWSAANGSIADAVETARAYVDRRRSRRSSPLPDNARLPPPCAAPPDHLLDSAARHRRPDLGVARSEAPARPASDGRRRPGSGGRTWSSDRRRRCGRKQVAAASAGQARPSVAGELELVVAVAAVDGAVVAAASCRRPAGPARARRRSRRGAARPGPG